MVEFDERPPPVVVFSPTDPSGGAGLQADILTLHALGCHALGVATGTTSQDADRFRSYAPAPPRLVREQFGSVRAAAGRARAAKVGAVGTPGLARAIGELVRGLPRRTRLVVDPVVAPSGSRRPFMDARTLDAARGHLLGRADVLTPNGSEARALTGRRRTDDAVAALLDLGCAHVLVSSLAARGKTVTAQLHSARGIAGEWDFSRRRECHGTGCTLAAAVAAKLAMGLPVPESVDLALRFAYDSILYAYSIPGLGKKGIPRRVARRPDLTS